MKQATNIAMELQRERQRKFLLFLPVILIPFMTLLLWSAGMVGGVKAETTNHIDKIGFNFHLPVATQAKDSNWNKMQYYAQADKDSQKLLALRKNDGSDTNMFTASNTDENGAAGLQINTDPKEKLIEEKIAALNKKLNAPTSTNPENSSYENELPDPPPVEKQAALQRMQEIQQWAAQPSMSGVVKDTQESDPALNKLDGMLNKVLDIQHPERVQQQLQQESEKNKKQVYPVLTKENKVAISLLQNVRQQNMVNDSDKNDSLIIQQSATINHRFYGLNDNASNHTVVNTIAAEIPEQQVLVNGATVKLRLLNDVYIRGTLVPKDQLLYGIANLKGERLDIDIRSIGYSGQILPVALSVYDMDGQQGLYIPGAITRDAAKQSAGQGVETMNFGTLDASLGAQAASAGIQAAKSLIGKKVKLVKVMVRSGYKVWLRDMNDKK